MRGFNWQLVVRPLGPWGCAALGWAKLDAMAGRGEAGRREAAGIAGCYCWRVHLSAYRAPRTAIQLAAVINRNDRFAANSVRCCSAAWRGVAWRGVARRGVGLFAHSHTLACS